MNPHLKTSCITGLLLMTASFANAHTLAASRAVPALPDSLPGSDTSAADSRLETEALLPPYFVAETQAKGYEWGMILEHYLNPPDDIGVARFNYGALKANQADQDALTRYIEALEATDVSKLTHNETVAFWANLYNAVTIRVVIENYPVKSIRDIRSGWRAGPWRRNLVTVTGQKMSLDDIEHKTLREKYPSPHIHYMVNCASIGCPNLKATPWAADTLVADQEAAARMFINSPRGVRITEKGLKVSSIYKWFKEDFGGSEANILAHLRKYADEELRTAIDEGAKISDYGYIWALNE